MPYRSVGSAILQTGITEELVLVYRNRVVLAANDTEEEAINLLKILFWNGKCRGLMDRYYNMLDFMHRPIVKRAAPLQQLQIIYCMLKGRKPPYIGQGQPGILLA